MKTYRVVYADIPWPEDKLSGSRTNQARRHYPTMTVDEIEQLPIPALTDDDASVLLLWVTPRHVPLALRLVEEWGFTFINFAFTWMKYNFDTCKLAFGTGHYTKNNAEYVILARKGKALEIKDRSINSAVLEPRDRVHSRKPATVRDRISSLFGDVPRIELFARQKFDGWDAWGNEVESDVDLSIYPMPLGKWIRDHIDEV